ncbi:ABC transporter ATP-binding protein [Knoellia subterranea]|uniref:ABC transporter ATP-binding protein n=1 Tax=Knoellia subterranea KCTC 19937 TaxID=1385521 RepID=A0A0A0JPQ2_9MICO|nr:ABC transporter ATP-binding protein [Knoellia subterranea]KGN39133.1 ABC transporter ATP-binding protein [Knoellia subterranea KCTC 19937]
MSEQTNKSKSGLSFVLDLAKPYRRKITTLSSASFVGGLLEAGFLVLITGLMLSLASGELPTLPVTGPLESRSTVLGLASAALIARLILGLLTAKITADLGAMVTVDYRKRLSHAFFDSDWKTQQAEPSGRLQELMGSFVVQVNLAMTSLTQGISAALSLIGFIGTGFFVQPQATLAVLGALAILGGIVTPLRSLIRRQSHRSTTSTLAFVASVAELGSLGREMQTFGVRGSFKERIDSLAKTAAEDRRRANFTTGTLTPVYTFLAYSAILAGAGWASTISIGNLGAIGAVLLLMMRSLSYAQQILSVSGAISMAQPYLHTVNAAISGYLANPAAAASKRSDNVTPLALQEVSFAYESDRLALRSATICIQRGEMVGVIGPSGAGKSTVAQLLLGLREPDAGQVLVGGLDLATMDRTWWTERVSFVAQEPALMTGTVAENIRFFREGIVDEEIHRAAERANILNDILALPEGFATHLGERGTRLSGGQRQRLSIARSLATEPELLILDEPTSALDSRSEELIRNSLAQLHGSVTMVIIAHRMSTLDLCDKIAVIENGEVTAFAHPKVLASTNAYYQNSFRIQES